MNTNLLRNGRKQALLLLVFLFCSLLSNPLVGVKAEESIYFPQTGKTLSGTFLRYWQERGGLPVFGYPTTEAELEVDPQTGKTFLSQWFERNRFELHPEYAGTPYEVLLGLLGHQLTIGREQETPFQSVTDPNAGPTATYYPQTGHTLAGRFRDYWNKNGGLFLFGYPISQEFEEQNPSDGKRYTVQWFERARFEYHPEYAGTPYEELLGLLGNQITGGAGYPDPPANLVSSPLVVPEQYRVGAFQTSRTMQIMPGFKLSVFVAGLVSPRMMALAPNGDLFVTESDYGGGIGKIKIIRDNNHDGIADQVLVYDENLQRYPHGIAFYGNYLYVALETRVIRYRYQPGDIKPASPAETIIDNIPAGGHNTRTITFGPDGKLYLSIGSTCDACVETNPYWAAVWQFNPDGSNGQAYATGLRNAVGLAFDPKTNLLWASVNGRNTLGNDFPPEQLTPLRPSGNYGWPYCAGSNPPRPDPVYGTGKADFCSKEADSSLLTLPAHVAPLGIAFYNPTTSQFPAVFQGGLFVAQHGAAASERPIYGDGLRFVSTRPGKIHQPAYTVVSGWITPDGKNYWGRVADPLVGSDGSLYLTDDYAGAIYRLTYDRN